MRVVVVGAGLAGLAATCSLAEQGCEVVLVERSRLVGGKATSFVVDGVEVDNGQHVHLACCTEYLDFVASLGMSESLWTQPRFEVTVLRRDGRSSRLRAARALPASLRLLPSFALYAPLGVVAKMQVARALRRLSDEAEAGETFAEWLARHGQGRAALEGFWELFVVPALNARLDEVSAADALFVVRTAFSSDPDAARIGWARVPLARIAEAAAARASELHLRTAVVSLLDDGDSVRGVRCADAEEIHGDAVVLAVPPARLASLLGGRRPWVLGPGRVSVARHRRRPPLVRRAGRAALRGAHALARAVGLREATRVPLLQPERRRHAGGLAGEGPRRALPRRAHGGVATAARHAPGPRRRHPRPRGHVHPRARSPPSQLANSAPQPCRGRRLDRHGVAGDDGVGGPQRPRRGASG